MMGTYLDESDLRRMGYVCTECGEVKTVLKSCRKGCTRICQDCLEKQDRHFIFCEKCRDMTLQNWKGTD